MSEQAATSGDHDSALPRGSGDFTLGAALIQPALNRIVTGDRIAQVEPKVMQVLTVMSARPGVVIPRQHFLDTVWADTVGDDYLLNRAVSELRKALDDDPQSPGYIETIRKSGYRLIAPIAPARVASLVRTPPSARAEGSLDAGTPDAPDRARPLPSEATRTNRALGLLACLIVVMLAMTILLLATRDRGEGPTRSVADRYDVRPLTSLVGREIEPALSPDGSRVAYAWDGGANGRFDILVQTIGTESMLNLTESDLDERYPVWTPDGRHLLFVRPAADGGASVLRIPSLGGTATRLLTDGEAAEVRGLALSPDGQTLVYSRRRSAVDPHQLVLADSSGGSIRILTDPPAGTLGDIDPLFAGDGQSVVFIRAVNEVTKDLHQVAVDGGAPHRLTFDNRKLSGLAWSPDGTRLLFGSTRSGLYRIWSLDPENAAPELVDLGGEAIQQLATAPGIDRIVFEEWTHRARLRRIDLDDDTATVATQPIGSTRWDSNPSYAPDGTRIAFSSTRSGPPAIWVSDLAGRGAVEVASLGGAFMERPAWSPDGSRIAFDGSPDGRTSIFLVSPDGGDLLKWTDSDADSRNPAWSQDSARLYYESNGDGVWRIHVRSIATGETLVIAAQSALNPRESRDGSWLYFSKPDVRGLWRIATSDLQAAPERIVPDLDPRDGENWAPASNGLYYIRRPTGAPPLLSFLDSTSGQVRDLMAFTTGFDGWGLELSPDERTILYSELDIRESDLHIATPRD